MIQLSKRARERGPAGGVHRQEELNAWRKNRSLCLRSGNWHRHGFNPANDLPHYDGLNTSHNTKLGDGPAIYIMDRGTIGDQRLIKWLIESAEAEKIPWQFRQPGMGGTDAGEIHKTRAGVPSVSVSVPQRYLHSAAGLIRIHDELNTLKMIHTALKRLDRSILNRQEKK